MHYAQLSSARALQAGLQAPAAQPSSGVVSHASTAKPACRGYTLRQPVWGDAGALRCCCSDCLGGRGLTPSAAPASKQPAHSHPSCTQANAVIRLPQQSLAHSLLGTT